MLINSGNVNLKSSFKLTNRLPNSNSDNYNYRLDQILTDIDFNDDSVLNKIASIEQEIEQYSNLTDEEMVTLLSATQVARYSYNYWSENWNAWLALGNQNKSRNKMYAKESSPGGNIVKGDVTGAIGGKVSALVVNLIPIAEQVAYGGAIIGVSLAVD